MKTPILRSGLRFHHRWLTLPLDRMLRFLSFLGLVLGMTACRAPEPVAQSNQSSDTTGQLLPNAFFLKHSSEPSFESMMGKALSAEGASALAARLANEQCERQYRRKPFKAEQYPAVLQDGVYHWGQLDVGGHEGFSASVMFFADGGRAYVEVYFSSDALIAR